MLTDGDYEKPVSPFEAFGQVAADLPDQELLVRAI
jgi:hypothetical protein